MNFETFYNIDCPKQVAVYRNILCSLHYQLQRRVYRKVTLPKQ